jgi:hypothetical protein
MTPLLSGEMKAGRRHRKLLASLVERKRSFASANAVTRFRGDCSAAWIVGKGKPDLGRLG